MNCAAQSFRWCSRSFVTKVSPVTHATTFPYLERALDGLTDPIAKTTSVTVACWPFAALLSLAWRISVVPGAPRTSGTNLRAMLSSGARTRTTATRSTLNVKSSTADQKCKIVHGRPNTVDRPLFRWSHEPVPRFTCPDTNRMRLDVGRIV